MKVIDLSGYSFSGKSAVYDLLNEFEGYLCQSKEFEFDILRVAGGILDLENSLVCNWSPIRSCEAIRRFKRLIKSYGGTSSLKSRLSSIGYQYDEYFPGFSKLSGKYIESLVETSWISEWPYALNDLAVSSVLFRKVKNKLGLNAAFEFDVYLSRPSSEEFIASTRNYFNQLFSNSMNSNKRAIVLNNAFEPFFPLRSHKYFSAAKSIIVDRDPRDIYISATRQGLVGHANVGKAVIGSCLDDFVKRFQAYRSNNKNDHVDIFRLSFESLVLEYDSTRISILEFLGEDESVHVHPLKYFDPADSIRGVGLWKNASGRLRDEINIIHEELNEYCFDM